MMNNKIEVSESLSWDSDEKAEVVQVIKMKRDSKDDYYKELGDSSSRSITIINNNSPTATPPFTRTHHIPPSPTLHSLRSNDNFQSCATTKNQSSASDDGVPTVVEATRPPVKLKTITVVGPEEGRGGEDDDDGSNYFLKNKKDGNNNKLNMALLGLRISAFVFCLISFSVLVADNKQGVKILRQNSNVSESFIWFKEFRYSLSINVIGILYSGLQICDLVKYLITEKHTMNPVFRGYFNFAMDQILTYLLMSASSSSSSAVTEAYKFQIMATVSVAFSYIAFVAFALTSLVSGYIICKLKLLNPNHSVYSNTILYGSTTSAHPVRNNK